MKPAKTSKSGAAVPDLEQVAGHIRRHGAAVSASTLTRILTQGQTGDGRLIQGSLRKLVKGGEVTRLGKPGRYVPGH